MLEIIDYKEEYGEIVYPEGFKEQLVGKTIEEQADCFCISGQTTFRNTGWSERKSEYKGRLSEKDGITVVIKDGLIAGVVAKNDSGRECFVGPENGICTYYAEDNNGAGYKTRADYLHLVCVPEIKK